MSDEDLKEMNKDALKEALRERGLKVSGTRDELEERLRQSAESAEVVVDRELIKCPHCGADELQKRMFQRKLKKTIHVYAVGRSGRQRVRSCRCRGCGCTWTASEQMSKAELKARGIG